MHDIGFVIGALGAIHRIALKLRKHNTNDLPPRLPTGTVGQGPADEHAPAEAHRQEQTQFDADLRRILAEVPNEQRRRPGAHGVVDE